MSEVKVKRTRRSRRKICSEDGCERFVSARGLCGMHIKRLRTSGAPLPPTRAESLWDQVCGRCHDRKAAEDFVPSMRRPGGYCKECGNAYARDNGTPEVRRRRNLWAAYRMRPEDFDAMLAAQGGGCAICGSDEQLTVDHDHRCCPMKPTCGFCVRGILCAGCNKGIGHLGENRERLRNAILYLGAGT